MPWERMWTFARQHAEVAELSCIFRIIVSLSGLGNYWVVSRHRKRPPEIVTGNLALRGEQWVGTIYPFNNGTGCSAAWLARLVWDQ